MDTVNGVASLHADLLFSYATRTRRMMAFKGIRHIPQTGDFSHAYIRRVELRFSLAASGSQAKRRTEPSARRG
jgi:hypothetical protein